MCVHVLFQFSALNLDSDVHISSVFLCGLTVHFICAQILTFSKFSTTEQFFHRFTEADI